MISSFRIHFYLFSLPFLSFLLKSSISRSLCSPSFCYYFLLQAVFDLFSFFSFLFDSFLFFHYLVFFFFSFEYSPFIPIPYEEKYSRTHIYLSYRLYNPYHSSLLFPFLNWIGDSQSPQLKYYPLQLRFIFSISEAKKGFWSCSSRTSYFANQLYIFFLGHQLRKFLYSVLRRQSHRSVSIFFGFFSPSFLKN